MKKDKDVTITMLASDWKIIESIMRAIDEYGTTMSGSACLGDYVDDNKEEELQDLCLMFADEIRDQLKKQE